jgi:hypothetical protein
VGSRTVGLVLAAFGAATPIASDGLRYAPPPGLVLERTIERELHLELREFSLGTQAFDDPKVFGADMDDRLRVVVTDEILEMGDARPTRLRRTFDELGGEMAGSSCSSRACRRSSRLEGRTVVFTWSEEDGSYDARLEHAPDRRSPLQGLVEDLDLRAFLPDTEVEDGERWSVDPRCLGALFLPGGDLELAVSDGDIVQRLAALFSRELEGWIQATYRGQREEDGVEVEHVDLAAKLEARFADLAGDEEGSLKLELQGILYWHIAGGHVAFLELSGPIGLELRLTTGWSHVAFNARYAGDATLRIAVR